MFSEKGFLFQVRFNNYESKFNDTITMFALSLAYREKMEYYLNLTSSIIDKENYHDVIDIKKDFYVFNLQYFLVIQCTITTNNNMQYGKLYFNITIF
ncbi:hypothetical protein L8W54_06265 [Campylobacter lari]|nr:hypothetical protein [Campylobacter lari]